MDDNRPTFKDAPWGYPLCFNEGCAMREKCMHYYMGQQAPPTMTKGTAIYPSALDNGQCKHFAEICKVDFAWGFNGLFKNVPKEEVSKVRKALRNYLSHGVSTYYRYHNGEKLLSPARQKEIMDFIAQFGSTEGLSFDNYITKYDFT